VTSSGDAAGLNNRSDLNWLLSQMVGDCASRTPTFGGRLQPGVNAPDARVHGYLGADISATHSGYRKLARISGRLA